MDSLNEKLLIDFMNNFFGYGNLKGEYWFVGKEEGGGNSIKEINSRIEKWEKENKPTVLDNYELHKEIKDPKGNSYSYYFNGSKSKCQRTWAGLIKVLMCINQEQFPTLEEVKVFQSNHLGRKKSNNCLLEILPLPSPSAGTFKYNEWTNLDFLTSRENYEKEMKQVRVQKLKELIAHNKPKCVIFYSSSPKYIEYWSEISNINFMGIKNVEIENRNGKSYNSKFGNFNNTCFTIIHHPTYTGLSNNYFKKVGELLKNCGV